VKNWITVLKSGFVIFLVSLLCIINLSAEEPLLFMYESEPLSIYTIAQHEMLRKIENRQEVERVSLIRFTDDYSKLNDRSILLELPDGERILIDQFTIKTRGTEGIILTGKMTDIHGTVTLVSRDKNVTGLVQVEDTMYTIEPLGDGLHAIASIDQSKFSGECKPLVFENEPENETGYNSNMHQVYEPVIVDVLVVYTHDARDAVGDIMGLIDLSIELTNESFENSDIPIELRLVSADIVAYQERSGNLVEELQWMTYADIIRNLRRKYGADLTVMLVATGTMCGRAYTNSIPESALSVVHTSCSAANYTFAHEIGHNFGAQHDIETTVNEYYQYGHGYRYYPGGWRTIMAYFPPVMRINYWSNPDIYFEGTPTGTEEWENNARVLRERAVVVANFNELPPLSVSINGPDELRPSNKGEWYISHASGGYPPYRYQWYKVDHYGTKEDFGTTMSIEMENQHPFTVMVEVTDRFDYASIASISVFVPNKPEQFIVHQNFPNPFNPNTTIYYDITVSSQVRITIYDIMGRKIINLVDSVHEVGYYSAVWNGINERGSKVASGQYMYRVTATPVESLNVNNSHISTHTMHFLK